MIKEDNVFRYLNRSILSHIKDIPNIKDKIIEHSTKIIDQTDSRDYNLRIESNSIARNVAMAQQDWINAAVYDIVVHILKERINQC